MASRGRGPAYVKPKREESFFDYRSRTLKTESEYWLKIRTQELSFSHLDRVRGILKNLMKDYANYPLVDMNNLFLAEVRSKLLARGLAPATVNRWTNVITTIVNYSYRNNRIDQNPTTGFGLLNEFREDMCFWEVDEVSKFLAFANEKYPPSSNKRWVYIVYLMALNTGVRAGEVWGLKVKDVNFGRRFINIVSQLLRKERSLATTKGKNIRKVPCNPKLSKELKSLFREREGRESFIFQSTTGSAGTHSNFKKRHFYVDMEAAQVRKIRFHDFRHTALTLMVESGISLRVVQSIAGHADIQTTMKYVHLLGDSIENVADCFCLT